MVAIDERSITLKWNLVTSWIGTINILAESPVKQVQLPQGQSLKNNLLLPTEKSRHQSPYSLQ